MHKMSDFLLLRFCIKRLIIYLKKISLFFAFFWKSTAMESKDIIIFVFVFAALAFSLYKKYVKKNQPGQFSDKPSKTGSSVFSGKDDDYEPYSKK